MDTENLATNRENWRSIDGFGNYEVSQIGRVRNATSERILKGMLSNSGYLQVSLYKNGKRKVQYIHQLVAREWMLNPEGKRCVDHIDGNRTHNHFENLRWASSSENSRNMKKHTDGSSVYKGVCYCNKSKKWKSRIRVDGKEKHLGYFTDEREAAKAYDTAAIEHYGVFAKLNDLTIV